MSTEENTEPVAAPNEPEPPSEPVEPSSADPVATDTAPVEAKPADEKPKKEKKPRAPRKKKTTPSHPPYFEMIKEAITALDDNTGSSSYAIAKYMEQNHKDELPANYKKVLAIQLKNFTAKGKLEKIRASFKLKEVDVPKKKKKPLTKEITKIPTKARSKRKAPAAVTGTEMKKKSTSRPTRAKKAKKAAPPKPKQPKSIKSSTSKKANKAVAG
ncbi:Histone H1 [Rhynchospora pubera]|uniref:Histone H1 n=1 Tax=Rhynchospora pubera TaxID=906938 RepID=A0AAV8GQ34_9POAL|nr:Histone H1 [Rhynchospora pubera]